MQNTETNTKTQADRKLEFRKVPVSVESDEALIRMVDVTNDGFQGGKVSKSDLLSWLVLHFEKHSFPAVRDDIRTTYFDKLAYLSSVVEELKKAQREGQSGPSIESLLNPLLSKTSP